METKLHRSSRITKLFSRAGITILLLAFNTNASAGLQIAAFSDGRAFGSLMSGDLERADRILPNRATRALDYADANNLCVLQILQKSEAAAVVSCQHALAKLNGTALVSRAKRTLLSELYTNLAVAQLLTGASLEAKESLAKAMSLAGTRGGEASNADVNYAQIHADALAVN